jgi:membrane-bound ClpP family serine protease
MRKPVTTGREGIIHAVGVVEYVAGDMLEVRVLGEHWRTRSADEPLRPGDSVEVVSVDGLTLGVTRIADERFDT